MMTSKKKPRILTEEEQSEICRMYEAKVPAHEIVEKFGIHRTTLPKLYKRRKGITRSLLPQINNPRYFQVIDSHEKAYFLGFISADGCITNSHGKGSTDVFAINIHSKDRIILDRLKEVLQLEHPVYIVKNSGKDQVSIRVSSQELCDDLRQYGLDYRKSLTMPNIWPLIPKEFRDSFALGYNDGDGCILVKKYTYKSPKGYSKTYKSLGFSICGTPEFLLGMVKNFGITNINIVEKRSIYALNINRKDDFWKVYNRMYANSDSTVHLARKRDVVKQI